MKSSSKSPVAPLGSAHEQAWRHYLRVNALLVRALDDRLRAESGMALVSYDALVQLSEAPQARLYMKDLAEALVYSASGITRLVDNLERSGFVRRETDPKNRRATLVCLTDEGRTALQGAWPHHLDDVRELWANHLSEEQAGALVDMLSGIRSNLEPGVTADRASG